MIGISVDKRGYYYVTGKVNVFQFMYSKYLDTIEFNDNEIVVVHGSYQINLARDWDKDNYMVQRLITEIEMAGKIGAYALVLHFGKHLLLSKSRAYNNMLSLLLYAHTATIKYSPTFILLETGAGQGTELCYKLDDLAFFYKKIQRIKQDGFFNRIKLCIDTCHIHVGGADISTKALAINYLEDFDEKIGLEHVKLIHLNGSRPDAGARLDRHSFIGTGTISVKALQVFYETFSPRNVPLVLETGGDMLKQIKKITLDNMVEQISRFIVGKEDTFSFRKILNQINLI